MGFCIPLMAALLIGLSVYTPTKSATIGSGTSGNVNQPTDNGVGLLPNPTEINAANNIILAYCSKDLRQDTSCELAPNSNQTAHGFIEVGLNMKGSFATDGSASQGLALAQGSGEEWNVVWVGQNCIPRNIVTKYNVPNTLKGCSQ